MEQIIENENNSRDEIKRKLREHFDGKIVRKDLTKKIKEGANVPTYVLEYLLGFLQKWFVCVISLAIMPEHELGGVCIFCSHDIFWI